MKDKLYFNDDIISRRGSPEYKHEVISEDLKSSRVPHQIFTNGKNNKKTPEILRQT